MQPLNQAFFKVPLKSLLKEFDLSSSDRLALYEILMNSFAVNQLPRDAVADMCAVLCSESWSWPRGQAKLEEEGVEATEAELLALLHRSVTFSAHKLHRRGQIRIGLQDDFPRELHVSSDGGTPQLFCGFAHGDILETTTDVIARLPPCDYLYCSCEWVLLLAPSHPPAPPKTLPPALG